MTLPEPWLTTARVEGLDASLLALTALTRDGGAWQVVVSLAVAEVSAQLCSTFDCLLSGKGCCPSFRADRAEFQPNMDTMRVMSAGNCKGSEINGHARVSLRFLYPSNPSTNLKPKPTTTPHLHPEPNPSPQLT